MIRMMDKDVKIRVENLNVFAGKQQILNNINIEIPRNKITVILGPSGCGKTTLLKCMNRLTDLYPELKVTGKIMIDHKNILEAGEDIYSLRQHMGLLSQRPYPLPMTIYNNIAYALKLRGVKGKRELHKEVMKYLKQANLLDEVRNRLREPASRLSIGQQQRLCLARGLAVNPEIILADEPTSALDPISSQAIEEKFVELKNDYTIVLVTHVLRQAKRIADHVIFMYLGEVIEQNEVREVFENPKMEKTKLYLGGTFN
jgi:phosphate transport system ATP-binding protein